MAEILVRRADAFKAREIQLFKSLQWDNLLEVRKQLESEIAQKAEILKEFNASFRKAVGFLEQC